MGIELKYIVRAALLLPVAFVFLHCGGSGSKSKDKAVDADRDFLLNRRTQLERNLNQALRNKKTKSTSKTIFCDLRKQLKKKGNSVIEVWNSELRSELDIAESDRLRRELKTSSSRRLGLRGRRSSGRSRLSRVDLNLFENLADRERKSYLIVDADSDYSVIRIQRDSRRKTINLVAFPLYAGIPDWPVYDLSLRSVLRELKVKCKKEKGSEEIKDKKQDKKGESKETEDDGDHESDFSSDDTDSYDEEFDDDLLLQIIETIESA